MKNEPVAWMQTWENQDSELKHTVNIEQIGKNDIPLYTHPSKDLTDEEIITIAEECDLYHFKYVNFARAILKEAGEK